MKELIWAIPLLPFLGALLNGVVLRGRISKQAAAWIACGVVGLAALLAMRRCVPGEEHVRDDRQAQDGGQGHGAASDECHALLADASAQQEAVEQRAQEGEDGDDPEKVSHRYPLSSATLSSVVVSRRRNRAIRMPSPTAASPAAMVMVKIEKIWPVRSESW